MTTHKKLDTQAKWVLHLKTMSPIFIRNSGEKIRFQQKYDIKAMQFPLLDETDYEQANYLIIPGSAFRGVFRAYLENISKSMLEERLDEHILTLFGRIHSKYDERPTIKGRIWISDAFIDKSNTVRKNVTPMDRLTQKPISKLTLISIKPETTFEITVTIDNPTSEEYAFMAFLLRALTSSDITIGSGKARGLGQIQLISCDTTIHQIGFQFLKTADQILIPTEHFTTEETLLGNNYFFSSTGKDSYTWLQFAVDELKNKVGGVR